MTQTPAPTVPDDGLSGSLADFVGTPARRVTDRAAGYHGWSNNRRSRGVWPFSNVLHDAPSPSVTVGNETGELRTGLNFASQDYLALSTDPRVKAAAERALNRYGLHSAGSPMLQGNTPESRALEAALGHALGYRHVVLFPTGWAAGFGSVYGLVRRDDHVILDQYAHNCLVVGAQAATANIWRVRHLDTDAYASRLRKVRRTYPDAAILVATEGLFSMDADSPDLIALQQLCRTYDATLLLDVAHDFGALGPNGTGLLGKSGLLGEIDLVMGSFSKTFASNGGFLATNSEAVSQYVKVCAAPHIFSNALSPLQCSVVAQALDIVRSDDGDRRRRELLRASTSVRTQLQNLGIQCLGAPSPIVPVPLGGEAVARLTASRCFDQGLFANLVEYPAVAKGEARFRMQVMASHTQEHCGRAATIVNDSLQAARLEVGRRHAGPSLLPIDPIGAGQKYDS